MQETLNTGGTEEHRVGRQFGMEASQTRDYCVAKNATLRAARPDSCLRKERLFGMTIDYLRPRRRMREVK